MTQVTPIYSFPYPEPTDAPDGPTQIHNLALAVETVVARTDKKPSNIIFTVTGSLLAAQVTGAKALRVRVWGPGGGGGGSAVNAAGNSSAGAGGGAGGYCESILDIATVTFPVTITVGTGGTAPTGAAGNTGSGPSSFAAQVVAAAGLGGQLGVTGLTPTIASLSLGGGAATIGDIKVPGGFGSPGRRFSATTVEGGAGAGGVGGSVTQITIGGAGSVGAAAIGFGGGGGGASAGPSVAVTFGGGVGGNGLVVVEPIY